MWHTGVDLARAYVRAQLYADMIKSTQDSQ